MHGKTTGLLLFSLLLLTAFANCKDSGSPTDPSRSIYTIRACNTNFRVRINDPAVAAEADARIGKGSGRIITGVVKAGSDGVNIGYPWHLDPDTIAFADVTVEVCDGCPDRIDSSWIGQRYCPWGTEVIAKH